MVVDGDGNNGECGFGVGDDYDDVRNVDVCLHLDTDPYCPNSIQDLVHFPQIVVNRKWSVYKYKDQSRMLSILQ